KPAFLAHAAGVVLPRLPVARGSLGLADRRDVEEEVGVGVADREAARARAAGEGGRATAGGFRHDLVPALRAGIDHATQGSNKRASRRAVVRKNLLGGA